mmetsp:Transcript_8763/g.8078  ORF Transcript_8763/g.8078 Transcript_8763/m.8078 type:complete len:201 (-) Transcript_8763:2666-3268(-)
MEPFLHLVHTHVLDLHVRVGEDFRPLDDQVQPIRVAHAFLSLGLDLGKFVHEELPLVVEVEDIGHQGQGAFVLLHKEVLAGLGDLIDDSEVLLHELAELLHPRRDLLAVLEDHKLLLRTRPILLKPDRLDLGLLLLLLTFPNDAPFFLLSLLFFFLGFFLLLLLVQLDVFVDFWVKGEEHGEDEVDDAVVVLEGGRLDDL